MPPAAIYTKESHGFPFPISFKDTCQNWKHFGILTEFENLKRTWLEKFQINYFTFPITLAFKIVDYRRLEVTEEDISNIDGIGNVFEQCYVEAVTGGVLLKTLLQLGKSCNFIKKRLWHWWFPVNFVKFLRTSFSQNTSRHLLLAMAEQITLTKSLWATLFCKTKTCFGLLKVVQILLKFFTLWWSTTKLMSHNMDAFETKTNI